MKSYQQRDQRFRKTEAIQAPRIVFSQHFVSSWFLSRKKVERTSLASQPIPSLPSESLTISIKGSRQRKSVICNILQLFQVIKCEEWYIPSLSIQHQPAYVPHTCKQIKIRDANDLSASSRFGFRISFKFYFPG